jgi:hypothetical protein
MSDKEDKKRKVNPVPKEQTTSIRLGKEKKKKRIIIKKKK